MTSYQQFLRGKLRVSPDAGKEPGAIHPVLFPFQRAIVEWACRRGRAAIFADCGMGKTLMQLEWARQVAERFLIVAPLSVAHQSVREAKKIGIPLVYVRADDDLGPFRITNYEHVHKFDLSRVDAVVLDESSILKNSAGVRRGELIDRCAQVPYRLACTATPSPNDPEEMTNHAEYLGVASRVEVLSQFFVHDEDGWRLKGHARRPFYDWVATWAVSVRQPSDLGYEDDGFILPPLNIEAIVVASPPKDGTLFPSVTDGVRGRSSERRDTIEARCHAAADHLSGVNGQTIVWCGLNDESKLLTGLIPGAVEISGADSVDSKERKLLDFIDGRTRVIVTKPSICGFGLNLQCASRMIFVGMNDSYESYYQAIRRSYRFGQKNPVDVRIVHTEAEGGIVDNVKAKESEAMTMSEELVQRCAATSSVSRTRAAAKDQELTAKPQRVTGEGWEMFHGDCIDVLAQMEEESVDLSVFSPPFATLFTYSNTVRDMGNCRDFDQFAEHFQYFPPLLLRATKPGRIAAVHVSQIAATMIGDGYFGVKDFRGLMLNQFKAAGWTHVGEVTVDKCPQAQAIRTKSKALLFVQKERDMSWLRPALADYVLIFRRPGENATPILNEDVTREDWIEWARPVWYGIRESDTLSVAEARADDDERHVCPLQLSLIERCIRLWSNRDDLVLSPFAGIGSEGYEALKADRRFVGIELKPEYFATACKNLRIAERSKDQMGLFAGADAEGTTA